MLEAAFRPTGEGLDRGSYNSFQRPLEALPEVFYRNSRIIECAQSRKLHVVKPAGAATADRCSWPQARRNQALPLQPFKSRVHSAGSHRAFHPQFYFLENGTTVSVLVEPDDGEQHGLFKSTQHICH